MWCWDRDPAKIEIAKGPTSSRKSFGHFPPGHVKTSFPSSVHTGSHAYTQLLVPSDPPTTPPPLSPALQLNWEQLPLLGQAWAGSSSTPEGLAGWKPEILPFLSLKGKSRFPCVRREGKDKEKKWELASPHRQPSYVALGKSLGPAGASASSSGKQG